MLSPSSLSHSALVGLFLIFGPQPALSVFDFVTFSSASQCSPFSVQFSGGSAPTSWPPQLTVVPFNTTPFSIPLFDAVFNDSSATGHAVTFLPLSQGTQFLASLDDGNGDSAGPVSDVITIDAHNSTKCLKSHTNQTTPPFSLATANVSQCESFTVDYNTVEVDAAPSIRAFIPGKLAFTVNQTADDDASGTASFLMDAAHGSKVALLLTNGKHKASSGLLTVGGNLRSSGTCLATAASSMGVGSNTTSSTTSTVSMSASANSWASKESTTSLSQSAIIAIAASSSAVILVVVVAMGFWVYCARRKMKAARATALEAGNVPPAPPPDAYPDMMEKSPSLPPAVPTPVHASWDFQMQTSWGSSRSKSTTQSGRTGNGAVAHNPLYTNPNLWLSSSTASNVLARSSKVSSPTSLLSAEMLPDAVSPISAPSSTRFTEANIARRTPPVASAASIRSHAASHALSHSHSRSQTSSSSAHGSRYAPASTPRSPVSPAPTISTVDIEHVLEMSARYAPGAGDATPPLPLRQSVYTPARDSLRMSAYYAGQFPDADGGGGRKAHSRTGSATAASSVRGRVTPPSLRIAIERRAPSSASSIYSLQEQEYEHESGVRPSRLLMTSPTVHVSADGEVIREPPHAHVPHSPMPSPFPSPL